MNNAGITIVEDSTFYNNIGNSGASIYMERAGSFIGLRNHFSLDPSYIKVPNVLLDLLKKKRD